MNEKRLTWQKASATASVIGQSAMILLTCLWTYWGAAEMYHEGWWGAWYNRLPYLVPILPTLGPTLLAFRWPLVGGAAITAVGAFVALFFGNAVAFIGLVITLLGLSFLVDGILKRRLGCSSLPEKKWHAQWRYRLALGLPALIFLGISAANLPVVLTRRDDGDRGARLVVGSGVALVWAPEGPGWNWQQPWGGYPSWQAIALYGLPPLGLGEKPGYQRLGTAGERTNFATESDMERYNLCLYLSEDGLILLDQPQHIWRMPTVAEVVRSLPRHGANASCNWSVMGDIPRRADCAMLPDKESPLWAADLPVIYYWTAEAYSAEDGYFVAYNGMVNAAYKTSGNPRHGYRCVREP